MTSPSGPSWDGAGRSGAGRSGGGWSGPGWGGAGSTHPAAETADGRVRIPANVEREDQLLAGLTARQLALLAIPTVAMWAAFVATRRLVPLPVFAAFAVPVAVVVLTLVLGRRDGLALDRLMLAGLRQARRPRRLVPAPDGVPDLPRWAAAGRQPTPPAPLELPARGISTSGVIDLGAAGTALVCQASTVSFALRTFAEQQALVAAFARYLSSLSAGVQILIRSTPVDLSATIAGLRQAAGGLPHPGLEAAALAHAEFLAGLAAERDLLTRQVLLVLTDPASDAGATGRLYRRAADAATGLAGAGISVTALDGAGTAAVLASAADPSALARPAGLSAPGDVIFGSGAAGSVAVSTTSGGEWS